MIFRLVWILGLVLLVQTATAEAATPSPKPSCNLFSWKNVVRFESLKTMQPEVVRILLDRFGPQTADRSNLMAGRDAPWQGTDMADPAHPSPLRRFIYGLKFGHRWFIWYERGGKNYSTHVVIYNFAPGAPAPILVTHLIPRLDDLCAVTRTLLTARILPRGGLDGGAW
jgi:hypothetical protein